MQSELARLKKYNLDFKKELGSKYQISKIYIDFEDALQNYNLQQVTAPFITNTFHVQRKSAIKSLENVIKDVSFLDRQLHYRKFIEKVDKDLLVKFKYMIKEPYVNLVFQKHYNLPKEIDAKQIKETDAYKEMYNLSVIVSMWSVEVELCSDLIERSILYGLYQPDDEKKDVIEKLKRDKSLKNKFTLQGFSKKLMRVIISKLIQRMSSFFYAKGVTFSSISWAACQGLVYYLMGQAALPWTLLVANVSIPWICGGFLATKLLDFVGKKITKREVISDLTYIGEALQGTIEDLMMEYQTIAEAIDQCFKAESEKEFEFFKQSLKKKIETLLDPEAITQKPKLKENNKLNQSRLCLSMITVKEEDDWVVCDLEEKIEEEEDEDEDENDDIVFVNDLPLIKKK